MAWSSSSLMIKRAKVMSSAAPLASIVNSSTRSGTSLARTTMFIFHLVHFPSLRPAIRQYLLLSTARPLEPSWRHLQNAASHKGMPQPEHLRRRSAPRVRATPTNACGLSPTENHPATSRRRRHRNIGCWYDCGSSLIIRRLEWPPIMRAALRKFHLHGRDSTDRDR